MDKTDAEIRKEYDAQFDDVQKQVGSKKLLIFSLLILSSILTSYFLNNPYGSYIPLMLIATYEWYRFFPRKIRSYYGLIRLLLCILIVALWNAFIFKIIIEGILYLFGYHYSSIGKIQHLFPYALIFTMFVQNKHDMDLNDKKRYMIHLFYDIPSFLLVIIFKLLNHPLNSLYSEITEHCYLGCLPFAKDVKILNDIGIKYVVNTCAEYKGPCRTYEKYNIKQLHLPTVDITAPSLKTIEKAIEFMNEAYRNNKKIFVHCKSGIGRSATIVLCHLIANEHMLPGDALKLIREKRPEVSPSIAIYPSVKLFLNSINNKKI